MSSPVDQAAAQQKAEEDARQRARGYIPDPLHEGQYIEKNSAVTDEQAINSYLQNQGTPYVSALREAQGQGVDSSKLSQKDFNSMFIGAMKTGNIQIGPNTPTYPGSNADKARQSLISQQQQQQQQQTKAQVQKLGAATNPYSPISPTVGGAKLTYLDAAPAPKGSSNNPFAISVVKEPPVKDYNPFTPVKDENGNVVDYSVSAGYLAIGDFKKTPKADGSGFDYYYRPKPQYQPLFYPTEVTYDLTPAEKTKVSYEAVQNINARGGSLDQQSINNEIANLLDTKYAVKNANGDSTGFLIPGSTQASPKEIDTKYAAFKADQIVNSANAGQVSGYDFTNNDKQLIRDNLAEQVKTGQLSAADANKQIENLKTISNLGATVSATNAANAQIAAQNERSRLEYNKSIADQIREGQALGYDVKANRTTDKDGNVNTELAYTPRKGTTQYRRLDYDTISYKKGDLYPISFTDSSGKTTPFTESVSSKYAAQPNSNPFGEFLFGSGTYGRSFVNSVAGVFGIKNPLGGVDNAVTGGALQQKGAQVKPQYSALEDAQNNLASGTSFKSLGGAHGRYAPNFTPEKSAAIISQAAQTNPGRLAGEAFALGGVTAATGEGIGKGAEAAGKGITKVVRFVKGGAGRTVGEDVASGETAGAKSATEIPGQERVSLVGEEGGASRFSSAKDVFSKQTVSDIADSLSFKNLSVKAKSFTSRPIKQGVETELGGTSDTASLSTDTTTSASTKPSSSTSTNTSSSASSFDTSPIGSGSATSSPSSSISITPARAEGVTPPEEFLGSKFTKPEDLTARPSKEERLQIAQEAKNVRSQSLSKEERGNLISDLMQQGKDFTSKAKTTGVVVKGKIRGAAEGVQTRTDALAERQDILTGLQNINKKVNPFKREAAGAPSELIGGKIPKVNKPRPINENRFQVENMDRELGKDYGVSKGSLIQIQKQAPKTVKYMNKVRARELAESKPTSSSLLEESKPAKQEVRGAKKKSISDFYSTSSLAPEEVNLGGSSHATPPGHTSPSSRSRSEGRVGISVDNILGTNRSVKNSTRSPEKNPSNLTSGLDSIMNPPRGKSKEFENLSIVPKHGNTSMIDLSTKSHSSTNTNSRERTREKTNNRENTNSMFDLGRQNDIMRTPKPKEPSKETKLKAPPLPKLGAGSYAFSSGSRATGISKVKKRAVVNPFIEGFNLEGEGKGAGSSFFGMSSKPKKSKKDKGIGLAFF